MHFMDESSVEILNASRSGCDQLSNLICLKYPSLSGPRLTHGLPPKPGVRPIDAHVQPGPPLATTGHPQPDARVEEQVSHFVRFRVSRVEGIAYASGSPGFRFSQR